MSLEQLYLLSEHLPAYGVGAGLLVFVLLCARQAARPVPVEASGARRG